MTADTTASKQEYEAAISFLFRDEPLARDIHERLAANYEVFTFSKRQEELAGSSGIEEFRDVFFRGSRLVVVLYRPDWGETRWTRIERTAIEERFLRDGWDFLLFVMLNSSDEPPKWLPQTRVRLNFDQYGIDELLGAIKHRLGLLGAQARPDDPVAQARRVSDTAAFNRERQRIYDSEEGVAAATAEAERVISAVDTLVARIHQATPDLEARGTGLQRAYVITNGRVSIQIAWHNMIANILRDAVLYVGEYVGLLTDPVGGGFVFPPPKELTSTLFKPDLDRALGWCWREPGGKLRTCQDVAQHCVERFLKLVERGSRGELPRLLP
jgi:hypothetical protein